MQRLTLIGMPGSGKSAVGKVIASRLGWGFLDTDKAIEERHGMPLQALIDQVGEESFRRLEEKSILNLHIAERTVIATGGSVVYSEKAMRRLKEISSVLFLDPPVEALESHIASEAPRGIVGMTEGGLEALYQERLPYYRRYCDFIVRLQSNSVEEAASEVLSELGLDRP